MSAIRAQLQESLGDAYLIERELGGGGMSRVFVALERALDRRVVVKLLPHELAAGMNSERFRREIQLVAALQHPHIVPVLATGDAAGAPYYTMPFIEGESLRARLAERGPRSLTESIRVLHGVIDALAYAHERGIVHRDIKPDNILMSGVHAVVTDFGVAKALTAANAALRDVDATGTGIGMAVGTPAYMAPEQAAGDPATDHRADIYAWGLVAYELIAGAAPFGKRTPHEMLAAHIAEEPRPVHELNADVPPELAELVMRCLEKRPSDRPQTAAEVRDALDGVTTPGGGTPTLRRSRGGWRRSVRLRTAASLMVLVGAVAAAFAFRPSPPAVDENQVAVLPFRVTGADPSLRYLREGMLDLLAAKLTGEGGPRSADPRTLMSAWRRAVQSDTADLPRERALELAEQIGAGQLLIGDISGTAERITLSASIVRVRDGRADPPRTVSGPADSLPALVDRLASELMALRAGEGERLGAFAGVPITALRAYLEGNAQYRRAHFAIAAREYKRAIAFDSTFALAGLGLAYASGWVGSPKERHDGMLVAYRSRARLSARDQALLVATAGPNFPAPSGWAELITAKERYAALAPDRAEAQFELGDGLFHFGAASGIPDAPRRAAEAFDRAIALDSSFLPAIEHLVMLELAERDTARVLQLGRLYLAADSTSENRDGVRWAMAAATGDRSAMRRLTAGDDTLTSMAFATISELPLALGLEVDGTQRLLDQRLARALPPMEHGNAALMAHDLALNRGQPSRAAALLDTAASVFPNPGFDEFQGVQNALFWDGDTTGVAVAARALRRRANAPGAAPARSGARPGYSRYHADLCISELWFLSNGDTSRTRVVTAALRDGLVPRDTVPTATLRTGCALVLDAQLAVTQRRADARALVDRLDVWLRNAPDGMAPQFGNLAAARLYERLGDTRAALFAVRRRLFFYGRAVFLSTYLRDEARLAEKAGDAAGAAEALRRYVAMRGDAEPALARDLADARDAYARTSRALSGR